MKRKLLSMGILLIVIAALVGCSTAGSYNKEGKKSFVTGDYEKAAESFRKAIAANTDRGEYYINYGMALVALGKYQETFTQFDRAYMEKDMLIIKENNKRSLRGKGIAYYYLQQYDQAIKEFKLALKIHELSSLDMDILYYMADSLTAVGSYGKAVKAYNSMLSIDKNNKFVYFKRAYCYQSLGEYEKSLADYDKAIKIDSSNYEFYFGKYYLVAEYNKEEADKVLTTAEKLKVISAKDQYNHAKVQYYQGNYEEAISELAKSYSKGFLDSYYYIGEIYRNQKDYTKAVYYYENYIKGGNITSSNVFNQIAVCLMKTDQNAAALEYLKRGLDYNDTKTLPILKRNEIIACEKLGNYQEAKKKMDQYLTSYPKDSQAIREAEFIDSRISPVFEQLPVQ